MNGGIAMLIAAVTVATIVAVILIGRQGPHSKSLGPQFSYEVDRYRHTDPSLVKYQETGSIQTPYETVHGICVGSDDSIYTIGDRKLTKHSPDGSEVFTASLDATPTCITISDGERIAIGFRNHIELFSAKGKREKSWTKAGVKSHFTSIATSPSAVYVADAGKRSVGVYDWSGNLLQEIDGKGVDDDARGFVIPSPYFDVAMGKEGLVWIINPGRHRVESYTTDGQFELSWGKTAMKVDGFSGCCNPVHLAVLPDGDFVTSEKGLNRIKTFAADGSFRDVVAGSEAFGPAENADDIDIAVDSKGRILALDPWKRTILIFERTTAPSR